VPCQQSDLKRALAHRTGTRFAAPERDQQRMQQQRDQHKIAESGQTTACIAASAGGNDVTHDGALQFQLNTRQQGAVRGLETVSGFVVLVGCILDAAKQAPLPVQLIIGRNIEHGVIIALYNT